MTDINNDTNLPSGHHNKRLKTTLRLIEAQVAKATSDDDLVAAIALLDGFSEPVKYDNDLLNKICIAVGALCLPAAGLVFHPALQSLEYAITAMAGVFITWLVNYFWKRLRKGSLSNLSDTIHSKSSLFDYGLMDKEFSSRQKIHALHQQFGSFKQGNNDNEIKRLVAGTHSGAEHSFAFEYFHYHYVDMRTETYTTTDKDGNTTTHTRTVYDHYDRYGFILPFPFVKSIRISETSFGWFSSSWKTSSIDFNKKFNVQTNSEMDAAKFLTPKILTEIAKAGEALGNMDLNFNTAGNLCFSFDNNNTLSGTRRSGLSRPASFKEEITKHNRLIALDAALEFLHRLMKYSDNNFA